MATKFREVIDADDTRLIEAAEVRMISDHIDVALLPAEQAVMRLVRFQMAQEEEKLGGWPDGFEFPLEAVGAYAVLADVLEAEVERMQKWIHECRDFAPYLYLVRGPGGEEADDAR